MASHLCGNITTQNGLLHMNSYSDILIPTVSMHHAWGTGMNNHTTTCTAHTSVNNLMDISQVLQPMKYLRGGETSSCDFIMSTQIHRVCVCVCVCVYVCV